MTAGGALTTAGGAVRSGSTTGTTGAAEGSGALLSTTAGITEGVDGAAAGALFSTTLLSGGTFGACGTPMPGWPRRLGSLAASAPGSTATAGRTVSWAGKFVAGRPSGECRRDPCGMLPCPGCCCTVAVSTGGTVGAIAGFSAALAGLTVSGGTAFGTAGGAVTTVGGSTGRRPLACCMCPRMGGCCCTTAVSFSWAMFSRISLTACCGTPSNPPIKTGFWIRSLISGRLMWAPGATAGSSTMATGASASLRP